MKLLATQRVERAVLAQVVHSRMDPAEAADSLLELGRLADTAGFEVAGQLTQNREKPDGGTFFGSGKVEDLKSLIAEKSANAVIFDNELGAIQAFNLAKALGVRIMDRTEIILEIFARRARSSEAQLQVELAQLQFQLSRIPVTEQQQRFKGGIGMKGPGESHLQLRNAPLRRRINELKKRLDEIQSRQTARGKAKRDWPVVSLVGYTNAGKSTLLNTLSDADAYVDDRLFATLDTKTRKVWLSGKRQILLTDTVGFIRNLPHNLVASFKSTLDVAVQADLLLIVVDAAYPRVDDHIAVCHRTLEEIGAKDVPHLLILNKCDRGSADNAVLHVTEKYPKAIPVSAKTGYGLDLLKRAMIEELQKCCTLWRLPSATSRT
ncbi:MAG TPA: GTPase HflX [Kiritimatiellia bacterium]|nr:GTPase HflX [Kiritimatiellia bacterium]HPS06839.1 GTPase HflX [Kiritimatiellia bacterium]